MYKTNKRTATPWDMANKSFPSSASVNVRPEISLCSIMPVNDIPSPFSEVVILKWNAEGMRTAITAIKSKEALS